MLKKEQNLIDIGKAVVIFVMPAIMALLGIAYIYIGFVKLKTELNWIFMIWGIVLIGAGIIILDYLRGKEKKKEIQSKKEQ